MLNFQADKLQLFAAKRRNEKRGEGVWMAEKFAEA